MSIKRVCIFMIAAFLLLDAFLLCIYFDGRDKMLNISSKRIDDVAEYFTNNGVKIDKKTIESRIPDNLIYTFLNDNNASSPEIFAKKLADSLGENTAYGFVETPDGVVYTFSDKDGNVKASFKLSSDGFTIEYGKEGFDKDSVENFDFDEMKEEKTGLDASQKETAEKFIKCLSSKSKPQFDIYGVYETAPYTVICASQTADGKTALDGFYLNLVEKDGEIVYACGKIICDDFKESYSEKLLDSINALRRVDIDSAKEILSQKIIYVLRYSDSGVYYLIPTWKIIYIDISGQQNIQYVDAILE
ncbi:MAG: hypothetical protein K6D98_06035 [Clostridiales bacterium]|nr:hypothetical protein [Clostridiales bacterium]